MVVLSVRNVLLGSVFALSACSFVLPESCPPGTDECSDDFSAVMSGNTQNQSHAVQEMPPSYNSSEQSKSKMSAHSLYAESAAPRDPVMAPAHVAGWNPAPNMMMRPAPGITKTIPGKKVMDLSSEVIQLRIAVDKRYSTFDAVKGQIMEDADRYHEIVGLITSKLQVGTTKSNPVVVDNWNRATYILDSINKDVIVLGQLASAAAADEASITYLIDSIRATYDIAGAVDEDHEKLHEIEKEAESLAIDIKKMSATVNKTLLRQQQYVSNERRNLGTLAMAIRDGQLYGKSLSDPSMFISSKRINQSMKDAAVDFKQAGTAIREAGNKMDARAVAKTARPLMTIKFDHKNLDYEQALYQAAKKALERRPDVEFEILEVVPSKNLSPLAVREAKQNAKGVRASLVEMGFPDERIVVTEIEDAVVEVPEVRIFVK